MTDILATYDTGLPSRRQSSAADQAADFIRLQTTHRRGQNTLVKQNCTGQYEIFQHEMRTKSEARRDTIVAIAKEVFREVSFDAASMSQIAARVGGSKATLYNYFSSKEELLLEVMLASAHNYAEDVLRLLQATGDLPTQLHRFVASLLKLIALPDTVEILRVAISVSGTTDVGRQFYEQGTHEVWLVIADLLRTEIAKGTLRDNADAQVMAAHLRCMCEMDMIRNLLGAQEVCSDTDADEKAHCIVDAFMRIYGVVPQH